MVATTKQKTNDAVSYLYELARGLPDGYDIELSFSNEECRLSLSDPNGDEIELYDECYTFDHAVLEAQEHYQDNLIQCENCGAVKPLEEYPETMANEEVVICPACDRQQFPKTVKQTREDSE